MALQVATGQYTPRLLRNFLADRGNQVVLAGLVATFTYSLVLLRRIHSPNGSDEQAVVPVVGVTVAVLLALGCVALLIYFFHHVTTQLRVETVMADVVEQTLATIDVVHPERGEDHTPVDLPEPPDDAMRLVARRSGHLQNVDLDRLLVVARGRGVNLRLRPWVGDHVVVGTTLAWAWPADGVDDGVGEDTEGFGCGDCTARCRSGVTAASSSTRRSACARSSTSRSGPCRRPSTTRPPPCWPCRS